MTAVLRASDSPLQSCNDNTVACPSGLRGRIANPFTVGSNPTATFPFGAGAGNRLPGSIAHYAKNLGHDLLHAVLPLFGKASGECG